MDCLEASALLAKAAQDAQADQRHSEARTYAMISAITSFYFKPQDQGEPFGPMMRMEGRRSAQPSDFSKAYAYLLVPQIDRVAHVGVRARLADVVWVLDRKQHEATPGLRLRPDRRGRVLRRGSFPSLHWIAPKTRSPGQIGDGRDPYTARTGQGHEFRTTFLFPN